MTDAEQITILLKQMAQLQVTIAQLQVSMVTAQDVYKTMGLFTGLLLAVTFGWGKQLKSVVHASKDDMRIMINANKNDMRDMIKNLMAVHVDGLIVQIRDLRERLNNHIDKGD